jgi:hypothetical protein
MNQQLKLPVAWPWLQSRRDPVAELDGIAQAKLDAKAEFRAVLDRHAERFGIAPKDVTSSIPSVRSMLSLPAPGDELPAEQAPRRRALRGELSSGQKRLCHPKPETRSDDAC